MAAGVVRAPAVAILAVRARSSRESRANRRAKHIEIMLLVIVVFFAGVLTILSPCILPVLPFVFARSEQRFLASGLPLLIGHDCPWRARCRR